MTALDDARSAMVYAEDAIANFGSNNKLTTLGREITPEELEQKIHRDTKVAALQASAPSRGAKMKAIVSHGKAAAKAGAGNCMELTSIACAYLKQHKCKSFEAVQLAAPGDHIFVVVGEPADGTGTFPSDMTQWSATAAICDAWAGISCLARDFPMQWRGKMQEWATNGVELMISRAAERGPGAYDRVPANHRFWLDAMNADKGKVAFTGAASSGCCLLATAACNTMGLPDDCEELQLLRRFRDEYVLTTTEGRLAVATYYAHAPSIVQKINASSNAEQDFQLVYKNTVQPAVSAIRIGDNSHAKQLFFKLVTSMKH